MLGEGPESVTAQLRVRRSAKLHVTAGEHSAHASTACKRTVSGSNPLTGSSEVFTFRVGLVSRLGLTFRGWVGPLGLGRWKGRRRCSFCRSGVGFPVPGRAGAVVVFAFVLVAWVRGGCRSGVRAGRRR